MEEDAPLVRCPMCGSVLTGQVGDEGLWECRYHLCHAIFRMPRARSSGQGMLVAEKEASYPVRGEEQTEDRKRYGQKESSVWKGPGSRSPGAKDLSSSRKPEEVSGRYTAIVNPYSLIVIGGGPAGLFCAARVAAAGKPVLLLEKMPGCGRKLLLTGSGQCNFTHDGEISSFFDKYGANGKFLRPCLMEYSNRDLIGFFAERGIAATIDESGKVFPASRKAGDVLSLLLAECREHGVEIRCREQVRDAGAEDNGFFVRTDHGVFRSAALAIATGGATYPGTGSTGDGYALAKKFGHTITPLAPALASVYGKEYPFSSLAGISFPGTAFSQFRNGKKIRQSAGDLLFTHTGLSGPGILHLSRYLEPGDVLKISFLPGMDPGHLTQSFTDWIAENGTRPVKSFLTERALPSRFAARLLEISGIPSGMKGAHLKRSARDHLVSNIVGYPFLVTRLAGFDEAMVTRGGVALSEVHPRTMESRIIPRLYCIGEVLDIDGDTGGYNLQAAFSTAVAAGRDIASD